MNFYKIKKMLKPYNMAVVSVFISVFSIAAVSLISMAGKNEIAQELDGVGLNGMSVTAYNSYNENITDLNLYNMLENCRDIDTLTPVLYDYAGLEFNTGYKTDSMCWGISPTAEKIVNLERLHGRMLTDFDINNSSYVCLIDETLAQLAYGRSNIVGKNISITTANGVFDFEIAGVVNKTSSVLNGMSGDFIPNFVYIPFTTMENIYRKTNLDQILINVNDENVDETAIMNYISREMAESIPVTIEITNLSRQRDTINNIVDIAFLALFAVSCVAVVVCSISVAASVNTAVSNARHDIGIKISLGARKTDIMAEFLFYSACACIIGIAAGAAGGILLLMAVNLFFKTAYTFDYVLLTRGISATILLTIIFSLYPSRQAAGLTPVKALNRE
ncbi:MAG: ABC transporter permease [Oscillospiraceae bacterium]|nr:ABC transporter permease [Oscillospiraceae bacterium]